MSMSLTPHRKLDIDNPYLQKVIKLQRQNALDADIRLKHEGNIKQMLRNMISNAVACNRHTKSVMREHTMLLYAIENTYKEAKNLEDLEDKYKCLLERDKRELHYAAATIGASRNFAKQYKDERHATLKLIIEMQHTVYKILQFGFEYLPFVKAVPALKCSFRDDHNCKLENKICSCCSSPKVEKKPAENTESLSSIFDESENLLKSVAEQLNSLKSAAKCKSNKDKVKDSKMKSDQINDAGAEAQENDAGAKENLVKDVQDKAYEQEVTKAKEDQVKQTKAREDQVKQAKAKEDLVKQAKAREDLVKQAKAREDVVKQAKTREYQVKEAKTKENQVKATKVKEVKEVKIKEEKKDTKSKEVKMKDPKSKENKVKDVKEKQNDRTKDDQAKVVHVKNSKTKDDKPKKQVKNVQASDDPTDDEPINYDKMPKLRRPSECSAAEWDDGINNIDSDASQRLPTFERASRNAKNVQSDDDHEIPELRHIKNQDDLDNIRNEKNQVLVRHRVHELHNTPTKLAFYEDEEDIVASRKRKRRKILCVSDSDEDNYADSVRLRSSYHSRLPSSSSSEETGRYSSSKYLRSGKRTKQREESKYGRKKRSRCSIETRRVERSPPYRRKKKEIDDMPCLKNALKIEDNESECGDVMKQGMEMISERGSVDMDIDSGSQNVVDEILQETPPEPPVTVKIEPPSEPIKRNPVTPPPPIDDEPSSTKCFVPSHFYEKNLGKHAGNARVTLSIAPHINQHGEYIEAEASPSYHNTKIGIATTSDNNNRSLPSLMANRVVCSQTVPESNVESVLHAALKRPLASAKSEPPLIPQSIPSVPQHSQHFMMMPPPFANPMFMYMPGTPPPPVPMPPWPYLPPPVTAADAFPVPPPALLPQWNFYGLPYGTYAPAPPPPRLPPRRPDHRDVQEPDPNRRMNH